MRDMSIGAAARASGVKIATIRYYEGIGLLANPARTDSNRRLYSAREMQQLAFIRHARELGFEIDQIRVMLDLQQSPSSSCAKVDAIASEHLAEVNKRIASLQALKRELERMLRACAHGKVGDCRIIETLQDHAKCCDDHTRERTLTQRKRTPSPRLRGEGIQTKNAR
jgi:Cu(I)-responsive transcriptional regulator